MYKVNCWFHLGNLRLSIRTLFCIWTLWRPGAPSPMKSASWCRVISRRKRCVFSARCNARSTLTIPFLWRSQSHLSILFYVESPPTPRIWKIGVDWADFHICRWSRAIPRNIRPARPYWSSSGRIVAFPSRRSGWSACSNGCFLSTTNITHQAFFVSSSASAVFSSSVVAFFSFKRNHNPYKRFG